MIPDKGSVNGGQIITIAGYNLKSQKFNVGTKSDTSSEDEGDDFIIWFEKTGKGFEEEAPIFCEMDRHFSIIAKHVGDHESIFCRTKAVTRRGKYQVFLKIDGGETMEVGMFYFEDNYSPMIEHIFPAASAPARKKGETVEEMSYWTEWYSIDNDADADENEQLGTIQRNDPKVFYKCKTPIGMEVYDLEKNQTFVPSVNFNSDGLPKPEKFNLWDGFVCTAAGQTGDVMEIEKCPDVKIRYQCIDGVIDLQGRIYTTNFDTVDEGTTEDANRLWHLPKFTGEDGLNMGDCELFLTRNDDSEHTMVKELITGDKGMLRCLANVAEPGSYNVTFRTQDEGYSTTSIHYNNHLLNDKLDGFNFEVYPQIRSLSPTGGSLDGGTIITITGTGFLSTFPGAAPTMVDIGGRGGCKILTNTATEITCLTEKVEELPEDLYAREWGAPMNDQDCAGMDLEHSNKTVSTMKECRAYCMSIFNCDTISFNHLTMKCYPKSGSPSCISSSTFHSRKILASSVPVTTDCILNKGETYQGDANIAEDGTACIDGTFCRNPTPETHMRPYCNTTSSMDDHALYCNIITCDQKLGQFVGSRGVQADFGMDIGYQGEWSANEWHLQPSYRYDASRRHIRDNTLLQSGNTFSYAGPYTEENYTGRQRFYFIAPRAGRYRFFINSDEEGGLYLHHPKTGQFETLLFVEEYQKLFQFDKKVYEQQSKTFSFAQGETVALEMYFEGRVESAYDGRGVVGVQYLGENYDTRFEWDKYVEMEDDPTQVQYQTEWQRHGWTVDTQHQEQHIVFVYDYNVDYKGETDEDGLLPEERDLHVVFRLQFCDNERRPNCRTTRNLKTAYWELKNTNDRIAANKEIIYEDIFSNICEYTSNDPTVSRHKWTSIVFHQDYENTKVWPYWYHTPTDYGAFCGRRAQKVGQGHYIFNYKASEYGNGYLQYKGRDPHQKKRAMPHMCMALKGGFAKISARLAYKQTDGTSFNGWITMATFDNDEFDYISPGDGAEWGYKCWNLVDILLRQTDIEPNRYNRPIPPIDWSETIQLMEMKLWSNDADRFDLDPVRAARFKYMQVDNVIFGNYGNTPPKLAQTEKAVSYDGHIVAKIDMYIEKSKVNDVGEKYDSIHMRYHGNTEGACSMNVKLPKVLAPDVDEWKAEYGETFSQASRPIIKTLNVREDSIPTHLSVVLGDGNNVLHTMYDYYYTGDYVRNDPQSDGTRMRYNAYTFNSQITHSGFAGTIDVTYERDTEGKVLSFQAGISPEDLQLGIIETWPETKKLNVDVKMGGDCQEGWRYDIVTHNRGNLGDLNWTLTIDPDFVASKNEMDSLLKHHDTFSEGGMYQSLIAGSMLGVPKIRPDVVVTVNKQRSGCSYVAPIDGDRETFEDSYATNCEFDFAKERTPKIIYNEYVATTSIVWKESFKLRVNMPPGTTVSSDATITIGGLLCPIVKKTEKMDYTEIVATFGPIPRGTYSIVFNEPHVGTTVFDAMWEAKAVITGTYPKSGSIFGGTEVTVSGSGLGVDTVIQVFADNRDCIPIPETVTYNDMKCRTVPADGAARRRRASGDSPTISSIKPNRISILGGELITIKGSNFGKQYDDNKVDVANKIESEERCVTEQHSFQRGCLGTRTSRSGEFEIISWSDSEIVAKSTMLENGEYEMQLYLGGFNSVRGYSNKEEFSMSLEITGVEPARTSLAGGQRVTIEGFGFANSAHTPTSNLNDEKHIEVFAGETRCHIQAVTSTSVECITGSSVKEVMIPSSGDHFPDMTITEGTAVRWQWSFSVGGMAPKIQFQRVDKDGDEESDEEQGHKDFWQKEPVQKTVGNFVKVFMTRGTYYYSTGFVDDNFSVFLSGKLKVIKGTERAEEIKILVTDTKSDREWGGVNEIWEHRAAHVKSAGRKRRASSCSYIHFNSENDNMDEGFSRILSLSGISMHQFHTILLQKVSF